MGSVNNVLGAVAAYAQRHSGCAREAEVAAQFTNLLETYKEHSFARQLQPGQPGHITCSTFIVNAAKTHTLLTHHKKLGHWFQLGGHADGDMCMYGVALKEAQEESGLPYTGFVPLGFDAMGGLRRPSTKALAITDIDIHTIPEHKGVRAHQHFDIRYTFRTGGKDGQASEVFTVSEESNALQWVELKNLESYSTEASLLRLAKKAQALL